MGLHHYIIIWSGNIPDEVIWYANREQGLWGVLLWVLIGLQFILPFFAMLSGRVRNEREPLLMIAGLTLSLRLVEALVLSMPGASVDGPILLLAIPAAGFAVIATWWMGFAAVLERVRSSRRDIAPLPDGFDSAGSPVLPQRF